MRDCMTCSFGMPGSTEPVIKSTVTLSPVCAAEYDGLLPQDTELAQKTNVPDVFGATQEDTQGLRIVSLEEVSPAGSTLPLVPEC